MCLTPVVVLLFVLLHQPNESSLSKFPFLVGRYTTSILPKSSIQFRSCHNIAVALLSMSFTTSILPEGDTSCSFPDNVIEYDTYNGVILKLNDTVSFSEVEFRERLSASLATWRKDGKRGIWIHLPTSFAHYVPICIKEGFDFHSAERGKVILTHWLDSSTPSKLPLGPTHQVGVGCLVLNKENKMLVVQEMTGPAAAKKLWKVPTGLLEPGEDIPTGAQRELKEETGLDGVLDKILCARHAPSLGGRASDLYYVCLIKLAESDEENPKIVKQDDEIAAVQWMDISDYCEQETWQNSPLYKELNNAMQTAIKNGGFEAKKMELGYRPGIQTIYVPAKM